MITLPTQSLQPAVTYDGIWLRNISIVANSPSQPIRALINICPFNSVSGSLNTQNTKNIAINDVYATAAVNTNVAAAMGAIFAYVQEQINSGSVIF